MTLLEMRKAAGLTVPQLLDRCPIKGIDIHQEVRPIAGPAGQDYFVTNDGEVFSCKAGRFLKGGYTGVHHNYRFVSIWQEGQCRQISVHRLVAEAFIPNPGNLPEVNHIDGNPFNNHVSNLEWCTHQHNVQHAWDTGLMKVRPCEVCGGSARAKSTICGKCRDWLRQKRHARYSGKPGYKYISMVAQGMTQAEVAAACGQSRQAIAAAIQQYQTRYR